MPIAQSEAAFRLIVVDNKALFDATVCFFSRNVPQKQYELGSIAAGQPRLFEVNNISNGDEVSLYLQSGGNAQEQWKTTPSPVYVTYTSSSLGMIKYIVGGTKQEPELKFEGVVGDAVKTPLPSLEEHRKQSNQLEKRPIPEASDELKKKTYWMQCVVQNKTQFMIVHDPPAYFDSGRYQDSPKNIEPYENMVFSVCNRDWEPTGATGGAAFRIVLDAVAEVPFAVGWTCPILGALKAGVAFSDKAADGYNIASEVGNSVKSTQEFSAVDERDKEVQFRFQITASPASTAWFVVNQLRTA